MCTKGILSYFILSLSYLYAVIQCPDLRPNSNTTIGIAGTGFTDTATYGCDSGFNLVGEATRTCQVNGTWSGTPPFCSRKLEAFYTSSFIILVTYLSCPIYGRFSYLSLNE